ncbi:outer membrane protein assembly factor BamB [Candidatus Pantoea edessiphila]|uniref:Outer membrane protein assembly factor BamB n=1 Tax=Candidatus Pantoea edessiphila TaxID=2044610 RepID=A0A2P5SYE4_9GAMM|nr:outer membrane protein assembly factor BamB [Candidatus Pantoea edessiphila]MBK4775513.1 outer membrane protein assembly factor BamB [Pantoea sp. Edef]PPI87359.1 outer membrane protein assembly factor BamB [Candidatus Pantoea edessiphila]
MSRNYFLSILVILLISGCSILGFQDNEMRPLELPKVNNKITPKQIWDDHIGSGINIYTNLHPAYQNKLVFAANRSGIIKALDLITGEERWKVNLSTTDTLTSDSSVLLSGGITTDKDNIYIGTEKGILYSLKVADGSIAWKTQLIGEILSSPVIDNNLIFVHTSNDFLQGINKNNGKITWNFELSNNYPISIRNSAKPTIVLDNLIIGDNKGRVNSISIKHNKILWRKHIANVNSDSLIDQKIQDINITPIIVNNVIYVSSYNGNVSAIDLISGEILWQQNFSNVKKLIVNNNHIYIIDINDRLFSLSTDSGSVIWVQNNLKYRQLTSPIIYKNYLVVGDMQGYLHWINTKNGEFVAQQKLSDSGFQTDPIVADKELLIQCNSGNIYAVII